MDSAITPDANSLFAAPREIPNGLQDQAAEERILANLADHPGWPLFRDAVLKRCDQLERLDGFNLSGKTTTEIGEAFLIGQAAAAKLREELSKVEAIAQVIRSLPDENT